MSTEHYEPGSTTGAQEAGCGQVDLSTLEIRHLDRQHRRLVARPPLILQPELDDSKQLYVIDDRGLDIHVFAETRCALLDELIDHIFFVWECYVLESDSNMVPAAQALAKSYRERFQEVPVAAQTS